jgi:hypothetical protein
MKLPNKILIGNNYNISKSRSEVQCCVYCERVIGKGKYAICLSNKSDELILLKYLWIHIDCIDLLQKSINSGVDPFRKDINTYNVIESL